MSLAQRGNFKILRFWFYLTALFTVCCLTFISIWQPSKILEMENVSSSDGFWIKLNKSVPTLTSFSVISPAHNSAGTISETAATAVESVQSFDTGSKLDRRPRLPRCLIVGARKAGTRALLEFLSLHPFIVASKKETHFFDSDENYGRGLSWYMKFMPPSSPGQITIEKTPAYFLSRKVPRRVNETLLPLISWRMKFLVVVKDPIERALSDYAKVRTSKIKLGIQYLTFEELSTDPITGNPTSMYKPITRSLYSLQLKNWLEYFTIDQFLFVNGESLIRNPASELEGVENFLGIPRYLTDDKFLWNETRGFYCMVFKHHDNACTSAPTDDRQTTTRLRANFDVTARHKTAALPLSPDKKPFLKHDNGYDPSGKCIKGNNVLGSQADEDGSNSNEIKCLSSSKGVKHPTLDPDFLTKLKRFFEPYNREFYKMTKKNFGW